jgi:phosphoribosylformylglycinamidine cyclo-ligase
MGTGDVVLGLRSNGVHSNGLSLIRRLIQDNPTLHYEAPAPFDTRVTLRQAIMRPTRIYIPALLPILKSQPGLIKAMAHITGGGLIGNLPRVLPTGLRVRIDWDAWTMPAIFSWLQGESGLSLEELAGVFNCGIGMCLVVAQQDCDALLEELKLLDEHHVVVVGQIVENTDSIDN